jgi:DNA-binding response OmpR family regulator
MNLNVPAVAPPKKSYRVLLVEDDPRAANAIASCVELYPGIVAWKLDVVDSIAMCCERLNTDGYHLLLLDLNLKNGKGAETFQKISACANRAIGLPTENRIPIVILTGDTLTDYSQLVLDGAQDYITKPFVTADLCQRMHMAILRFPWKRTEELKESIKNTIQEARESIAKSREATPS